MSIIFKAILNDQNDLLDDENASDAYGWFEIIDGDKILTVFKDNKCWVFLSLAFLIKHIYEIKEKDHYYIKWVGEDDGNIVGIKKINSEEIMLIWKQKGMIINLKEFAYAVKEESKNLLKKSVLINPKISNEGQYLQLQIYLDRFEI